MAGNKRPVKWHEENLKNIRLCIADLREQRRRLDETIAREERDCFYRQAQIDRAKADGVAEYDEDTFKPRKKWKNK